MPAIVKSRRINSSGINVFFMPSFSGVVFYFKNIFQTFGKEYNLIAFINLALNPEKLKTRISMRLDFLRT